MQSQPVSNQSIPDSHEIRDFFLIETLCFTKLLKNTLFIDHEQISVSIALKLMTFSRKEVIQPHLPVLLPCYDFTPVMKPTVVAALPKVRQTPSGEPHSHGVTGGVYKTRERIHRGMLIRDY